MPPNNKEDQALRPPRPQMCRKRPFRQGQALPGRFAGLDVHALASDIKYSRATDEDASGGGLCQRMLYRYDGQQQPRDLLVMTWSLGYFFEYV